MDVRRVPERPRDRVGNPSLSSPCDLLVELGSTEGVLREGPGSLWERKDGRSGKEILGSRVP